MFLVGFIAIILHSVVPSCDRIVPVDVYVPGRFISIILHSVVGGCDRIVPVDIYVPGRLYSDNFRF